MSELRHLDRETLARGISLFATLGMLGCGGSNCVTPPCAPVVAITVSVTSVISGQPIPNAFVDVNGVTGSPLICNQAPGSTCVVMGNPGTYELDIGGPGFQTVHRTVVVSGTSAACACPTVNTEHVDVGLPPNTKM